MAPPPEYDKEPKAPDKSATNISSEESKTLHNIVNDQHTNSDFKPLNTAVNVEVENNKHVEHLDDGQLRALLDEAITYKCPKDREGKSSLFNELLEEVEQDEQALEAAARELSGGRAARRARAGRRALPHSNSLQNLEQEALAAESALRRVRHAPHHHTSNVSARAHHGGSLPSDVDKSFLLGEEPAAARGAGGYLATVRCVNPPPLAERRVSASDANCPTEMELLNRRSKPPFPMTYTARATLEIGSSSVSSGRAVTTTTASNQVDSAIPFNCITSSEIVDSCNTTPSTAQSAIAEDTKPLQLGSCYGAVASLAGDAPPDPRHLAGPALAPTPVLPLVRAATARLEQQQSRSVISSSFNGLPLARTSYGSTASSAPDEFKKSLDENGNSVQGFSSPSSGSSQQKKPRRKKSSKNETVITSQEIDGYQGNKDLYEVLRFIESNAEHGRGPKLGRAKHKDDSEDKSSKKRSTERRKDKETKMKRATSMEELSRTKLEDLTDKPGKKERWPEGGAPGKAERRSWGDDSRDAYYYRDEPPAAEPPDADFQTVTKKRKPRRRADEGEREPEPGAGDPPRAARAPPSPRARRVSAPPSDRSNDSNDDMDSVHSLPADGPPARPAPPPPCAPASYADIARTRHNIPDLIESCNFYAEGEVLAGEGGGGGGGGAGGEAARRALESAPAAPGDADGYPALEPRAAAARRARDRDAKPTAPPASLRRDRKERPVEAVSPAPECPAPDVVADRRPPVILLDSAARPRDMDGITFGFDINEQLLSGPSRRPRCDLVRDAVEGAEEGAAGDGAGEGGGVPVRAGCAALRYVPPAPPPDTHHLLQIVDYVGAAWEDVVRCGSGKVRYFSE